jgi:ABC-type lipoprotein export system ATPase subunit
MDILLKTSDLGKEYDGHVVLAHNDIVAQTGRSIVFSASSGSGKSTLLSMLGLLLSPTNGEIEILGETTTGKNDQQLSSLRRESIGIMFQHTRLIGSLRAIENVLAPRSFMPTQAKRSHGLEERALFLLDAFGMGPWKDYYPYQLSVGQKRRIACARALLFDPPIIIADEPTNDLDEANAQGVMDALFATTERGHALLCATHDANIAARADEIMTLHEGTFKPAEA